MSQLSINNTNALTAYVENLNEAATKADVRNMPFVPPKGLVLTVACDTDHHIRLTVANGKGGTTLHVMPTGVIFSCRRIDDIKPKPKKLWPFTTWLQKKVGIV